MLYGHTSRELQPCTYDSSIQFCDEFFRIDEAPDILYEYIRGAPGTRVLVIDVLGVIWHCLYTGTGIHLLSLIHI